MSHNITIEGGTSVRLLTAGKYCDQDIVVTATGGSGGGGGANQLDELISGTITSINSNVDSIDQYACANKFNITSVNVPNATSIGNYAFQYCKALTSVNAPNATTVGQYSFRSCTSLKSIKLPSLTTISSSCFYTCTALEKVDLGAPKTIDSQVFYGCSTLATLIVRKTGSITTISSNSLPSGFAGNIYVPAELLDSYKTANRWSTHADRIFAIEDYPDICG